ncbi:thioredoxin domain-containing protein [Flagellimonas halotolerans]|uniref:Thioredoxin domain-containing protein n=1 Tax=Flagellimonas halotolerans TaxID=3112164 RepID=A0ABU6IMR1_9FLAO|nr:MULTISPECIES: thioredoxin domain-containing protein [unclassified Allomuricauda]MEC3964448.1 thioredoxin domain-containing protein [Muricauda sp. SYSU M86414]MEC4264318.1 thioredoxin domain-containing protein [Muricauda sp. SYSU M84420]
MKKVLFFIIITIATLSCKQKPKEVTHEHTNALIHETSPYLLQHAHNPVNWEAWHPNVLERAKKEDKLLLISIGYAACHWCHVMEKECFEDAEVAEVMNENFINIKIDREERPDVDQIYMDAIQMISGQGGWPLNIVALPDGRPFWGATYVPKDNWIKSLEQLAELYKKDKPRVTQYATDLANGLQAINLVENDKDSDLYSLDQLNVAIQNWTQYFDTFLGGHKRAPKFMMPNNWDFLLHYATAMDKPEIMGFVDTTLTRMAYGGVYDHVGGGFSRYAVDTKWHVPHFEKMLYDNGQLTSLYAKAYAVTKNELYKSVVEETIHFVQEELLDRSGGFYSSLDADSLDENGELAEGAYYVWTKEELTRLLGDDYEVFQAYFNINSYGHWEEGNYVPIRDKNDEEIAEKFKITVPTLITKINESLAILKKERSKRPKPRLDDKILTSWNGLMLKGLVDAYRYLGNDSYLKLAQKNAGFIEREMIKNDGSLYRNHKAGKSTINGFLEDYASVIDAYFSLYEVTFDEKWLDLAKNLLDYSKKHFFDEASGMFFYTSDEDQSLIRRTIEVDDNVISSSNSIMAINLYKFHKLYPGEGYGALSEQMLKNVQKDFDRRAQGFANWLHLVLFQNQDFYEIAILGEDYKSLGQQIGKEYVPNSILAGSRKEGNLELLKNRENPNKTLVYVCIEGACKLPVTKVEEALKQL